MNKTELLLVSLMEECDEVSQRVSKALRFSLDEIQEGQPFTNAQRIVYEFNDLLAVVLELEKRGILENTFDQAQIALKRLKIEKWMDYSAEMGVVNEA